MVHFHSQTLYGFVHQVLLLSIKQNPKRFFQLPLLKIPGLCREPLEVISSLHFPPSPSFPPGKNALRDPGTSFEGAKARFRGFGDR